MVDRIGMGQQLFQNTNIMNVQQQQQMIAESMRQNMMTSITPMTPQLTPRVDERTVEAAEFATEFRETFQQMDRAAGAMTPDRITGSTVFEGRDVEVENSDVLRAEAGEGATLQDLQVEVLELGEAQRMETRPFEGQATAGEALGILGEENLAVVIEQGDARETIEVAIDEETTVEAVLGDVAQAIEAADELAVEAQVVEGTGADDLEEGEVRLQLTAETVGERAAFQVEGEAAEDNDLLEQMELETVREAADARVEIDDLVEDEDFEVDGDRVVVDDERVEMVLQETGDTIVAVGPDVEAIREGVAAFASAFEQTVAFTQEQDNAELARLGDRLTGIVRQEADNLSAAGVNVDEDGRLDVDEAVLDEAIEEDPEGVEELFTQVAGRAEQVADEALTTPPSRFIEDETLADELLDDFLELQQFDPTGRLFSPVGVQPGMLFDFTL